MDTHRCAYDSLHNLGASLCPFTAEGDVKAELRGHSHTIVTGEDVTMGGTYTGEVVKVIEPLPYSGMYGPVYRIVTTDTYADGRKIQRVVQA